MVEGVTEPKWHYANLKASKFGLKGGAWYMFRLDANLMVTLMKIDFGEVRGHLTCCHQPIDSQQWVLVLKGTVIEGAVIDAQPQSAIFLTRQENSS